MGQQQMHPCQLSFVALWLFLQQLRPSIQQPARKPACCTLHFAAAARSLARPLLPLVLGAQAGRLAAGPHEPAPGPQGLAAYGQSLPKSCGMVCCCRCRRSHAVKPSAWPRMHQPGHAGARRDTAQLDCITGMLLQRRLSPCCSMLPPLCSSVQRGRGRREGASSGDCPLRPRILHEVGEPQASLFHCMHKIID